MHFPGLALAALVSLTRAVDVHVVAVGKNPNTNETALAFFPDRITAKPGSMVQFQFWTGNHTVTQSSFDKPCVPISAGTPGGNGSSTAAGIFSSFQPVAASRDMGMIPVFTVMINDSRPLWLYCSQGPHCGRGMAMVINEDAGANATRSLENYVKLARGVRVSDSNSSSGIAATSSGNGSWSGAGGSPAGGSPGVTVPVGGSPAPAESSTPAAAAAAPYVAVPGTMLVVLGAGFLFL